MLGLRLISSNAKRKKKYTEWLWSWKDNVRHKCTEDVLQVDWNWLYVVECRLGRLAYEQQLDEVRPLPGITVGFGCFFVCCCCFYSSAIYRT